MTSMKKAGAALTVFVCGTHLILDYGGSLEEDWNITPSIITRFLSILGVLGGLTFFLRSYMSGGWYDGTETIPGKTVIITGANTGIGKETALELARRGGRIIMACRDLDKAESAKKEIIAHTGSHNIVVKHLDLASLASVKEFADDINKNEQKIDILINNAGVMMCPKMLTKDGFEMQLGTNHIGHFLLTNLLLDKIKASAPSRIIILSSLAHTRAKMSFDDIMCENKYSSISQYQKSKLANLLHQLELVKRLEGTGVTVNAVHPGAVDTELARHLGAFLFTTLGRILTFPVTGILMKNPVEGAQTTLRVALDPALETVTGKYFSDCKEKAPSLEAYKTENAERLWKLSEEWTKDFQT